MRKIFVCVALLLLTFTLTAWGEHATNVVGTWTLNGQIVSVDVNNPDSPIGVYNSVATTMIITNQQGNLFYGYLNPQDPPHTNFYGAVVDKNIYITFSDTIVQGTINGHGTEIDFVAQQVEFSPDHQHPGTFVGIATKN